MKEILIDQIVSGIGKKINTLRTDQGLSLQQLAEKAGVSNTAIHKLEHSEMTPTITVLMKIAEALGVTVGFFLGENDNTGFEYTNGVEHTPYEERKRFSDSSGYIRNYLAFRLKNGKLLALINSMKAGSRSGLKPQSHGGEEFILCMSGEIQFEVNGKAYLLQEGDSIHFHADLPHRWEVMGEKNNDSLWIFTPLPIGGVTEPWK
jgi:transcriptional regulator with XRE-family HTH domain